MFRPLLSVAIVSLLAPAPPLAAAQAPQEALFQDLQWRNIGPANMAGRVTDIEAEDNHPSHVLVASASGGAWRSRCGRARAEPQSRLLPKQVALNGL